MKERFETSSFATMMRIILPIVLAILLIILLIITCNFINTGTIRSQTPQGTEGSFYVFHTNVTKKYVDFLENLDEEKYEILSIAKDDGSWYVTYKVTE